MNYRRARRKRQRNKEQAARDAITRASEMAAEIRERRELRPASIPDPFEHLRESPDEIARELAAARRAAEFARIAADQKRSEAEQRDRAQQARRQEVLRIADTKRAAGEQEVLPGYLVTLARIDGSDEYTAYVAPGSWQDRGKEKVWVSSRPKLPEGTDSLSLESPVGRAVVGRFTNDEVSIASEEGEHIWRIVHVVAFDEGTRPDANEVRGMSIDGEATVFGGHAVKAVEPKAHGMTTGLEDDPNDASKNLGFFARDNGAFGSFPGHDDYGEDSEP